MSKRKSYKVQIQVSDKVCKKRTLGKQPTTLPSFYTESVCCLFSAPTEVLFNKLCPNSLVHMQWCFIMTLSISKVHMQSFIGDHFPIRIFYCT